MSRLCGVEMCKIFTDKINYTPSLRLFNLLCSNPHFWHTHTLPGMGAAMPYLEKTPSAVVAAGFFLSPFLLGEAFFDPESWPQMSSPEKPKCVSFWKTLKAVLDLTKSGCRFLKFGLSVAPEDKVFPRLGWAPSGPSQKASEPQCHSVSAVPWVESLSYSSEPM